LQTSAKSAIAVFSIAAIALSAGGTWLCVAGDADAQLLPDQVQTQPARAPVPSAPTESMSGQQSVGSGATLEIPQAVKGCWEAIVTGPPDSVRYIKGPALAWLSTKRTLCFVEAPSGSFQITYQSSSADTSGAATRGHSVTGWKSTVEAMGGDRNGDFTLQAVSSSRQKIRTFLFFSDPIEYTTISELKCRFDGDALTAQVAAVSSCIGAPSYCDGAPTSTFTSHIEFHRVDIPQ
jgi:hypothetical protein